MLRSHFRRVDAVLITHIHYDHTGGIDDLRPFGENRMLPIYMESSVAEGIRNRLPYCFADHRYPGVPNIMLQEIGTEPFTIEGITVTPIRVMHYKLPILGYRIGGLAYITDALTIPETEYEKLEGVDVLVINALRKQPHLSHQTLNEALQVIGRVNPREAYLVHMSHHMGLTADVEKELPPHIHFAYDGLTVECL